MKAYARQKRLCSMREYIQNYYYISICENEILDLIASSIVVSIYVSNDHTVTIRTKVCPVKGVVGDNSLLCNMQSSDFKKVIARVPNVQYK